MRQKEDLYKSLNLADPALSNAALIQAMVDNPKLIERPIVVSRGQARIGRPPEQVLEIVLTHPRRACAALFYVGDSRSFTPISPARRTVLLFIHRSIHWTDEHEKADLHAP